jgi:hypothetical protein
MANVSTKSMSACALIQFPQKGCSSILPDRRFIQDIGITGGVLRIVFISLVERVNR